MANTLKPTEEKRIYFEGLRLFNRGEFFEAHEVWEEIWSQVPDPRRERFYQGIIQAAVTLELLRRGKAVGVRKVFVSCKTLLETLPSPFMGLDIGGFLERLRHAIQPAVEDLTAGSVRIQPDRLFAAELLYDPFLEPRNGEFR